MRKEKKDKKTSKSGKRNKGQCGMVSNERLVIPVHKYDAEVFRMLIQFVHTGTAYVTTENVTGELDRFDKKLQKASKPREENTYGRKCGPFKLKK